jgi:hypothetical protein
LALGSETFIKKHTAADHQSITADSIAARVLEAQPCKQARPQYTGINGVVVPGTLRDSRSVGMAVGRDPR